MNQKWGIVTVWVAVAVTGLFDGNAAIGVAFFAFLATLALAD